MTPRTAQFAPTAAQLQTRSGADLALAAYETCAPYYDVWTADYDHAGWLDTIERLALAHGLRGNRVLDAACGTGKSALPLVDHGYEVSACDISPKMLERAQTRLAGRADLFIADVRALPAQRRFDLVTCLDDALNYVLDQPGLEAALRSFAAVLERGGLAIFDLNTAATFRQLFTAGTDLPLADGRLRLRGLGPAPDGTVSAVVEPLPGAGPDGRPSLHVQRHHSPTAVRSACREARLDVLETYGQSTGGVLHREVNEDRHTKLLYVVRKP